MMSRNRFISLGGDCQPAHNLLRLTAARMPMFFDCIGTPLRSIVPLIESRFEDAFEPDALTWKRGDPWTVTDERYGLEAPHLFRECGDGHVRARVRAIRKSGEAFLNAILDPDPIVFVRRWYPAVDVGTYDDDEEEVQKALTAIHPRCIFLRLRDFGVGAPVIRGNILTCFNPPTAPPWTGDDALYERNFTMADRLASELFGSVSCPRGPVADYWNARGTTARSNGSVISW